MNGTEIVKWVGDAPHRIGLGKDGVWRFEDKTSYSDSPESESETLLLSSVANHLRSQ